MTTRTVLALAAAGVLLAFGGWIGWRVKPRPAPAPVVAETSPTLAQETVEQLERRPSLKRRLTTTELHPVRVTSSSDTLAPGASSTRFGILEGRKAGRSLSLSLLDHETGRVEKHDFELPRRDSDYTVRSGSRPVELRASRDFGVRFGAELVARGGVPLAGVPRPLLAAVSLAVPLRVGTEHVYGEPVVWWSAGDGLAAGVQMKLSTF